MAGTSSSSTTTTTTSSSSASSHFTPVVTVDSTKGIKVDAGDVAKPFRDEIKAKVNEMKSQGHGKRDANERK